MDFLKAIVDNKGDMSDSSEMIIPMLNYFAWTIGNDSALSHVRLIDSGAAGEVHEVNLSQ